MSIRLPALAACIVILAGFAASAQEISGRASVVDGDTIEISGERIRFNGVDAPESWQRCRDAAGDEYRCGKEAAFALDEWLAASRPTRCEFVERDRYGRMVANCFRADGVSVADWLIRNGWALDWPRYSDGEFAEAQAEAEAGKAGIWRGAFDQPCEARARRAKRKASC